LAQRAKRQLPLFLARLAKLGGLICLLLLLGTLGFAALEETSLRGAFVWSHDTIATVGSIPSPETTGGQVVKVLLIVLGVEPQPSGETVVEPSEIVVAMGTTSAMDRLEALFTPESARRERQRAG
jgi:hypothetical protein